MSDKEREFIKNNITHRMIRTNIIHRRITESFLDKTGVYQGQHRILMQLAREDFQSQKELAVALKVSTATIAISIKKLEKNGYITRQVDEEDNRLNKIYITPKGQKVVEDSKKIFQSIEENAFKGLTDKDKEDFERILDTIEKNLLNMEKESKSKKNE